VVTQILKEAINRRAPGLPSSCDVE